MGIAGFCLTREVWSIPYSSATETPAPATKYRTRELGLLLELELFQAVHHPGKLTKSTDPIMKFLLPTLASLISVVSAASILKGERIQQQDGRVRPRRDVVTSNYMQMKSGVIPHPDVEGINHRHLLRRQGAAAAAARNISAGLTNVHDIYYIVDLVVGNQTIPVSVDTGSSDTWVVQQPYQCVSYWYPYPGAVSFCTPPCLVDMWM